jgi:hypothetical protein
LHRRLEQCGGNRQEANRDSQSSDRGENACSRFDYNAARHSSGWAETFSVSVVPKRSG